MTPPPTYVVNVLINVISCLSFMFPLVTGSFWPWWKEPWGWNIVLLEISIGGALFPSALSIDAGVRSVAWLAWLRVAFLLMVGFIVVWRGALIYLTQRRGAIADAAAASDSPAAAGPAPAE